MKQILICWIGNTDLQASEGQDVGVGPIAQALDAREFDEVFFITDYEDCPRKALHQLDTKKNSNATPTI